MLFPDFYLDFSLPSYSGSLRLVWQIRHFHAKVVDLSVAIYLLKSRLVLRCITELRPKPSLN